MTGERRHCLPLWKVIHLRRKVDHGTTNRELRGWFGKPREQMSLDELCAVWRHLNTNPTYQGA